MLLTRTDVQAFNMGLSSLVPSTTLRFDLASDELITIADLQQFFDMWPDQLKVFLSLAGMTDKPFEHLDAFRRRDGGFELGVALGLLDCLLVSKPFEICRTVLGIDPVTLGLLGGLVALEFLRTLA